MIHTDGRFGEWGGNTFVLRIYKDYDQKAIMMDYKEFAGSKEPPPPPNSDMVFDSTKMWYEYKPMVTEKKGVVLSTEKIMLVEQAIIDLLKHKLTNNDIPYSGVVNEIILADSTFIVKDNPSIEWDNFQKLKAYVLEK